MPTTITQEQNPYIKLLEFMYEKKRATIAEIMEHTKLAESRVYQLVNHNNKTPIDKCIEVYEPNEMKEAGYDVEDGIQYFRLSYCGTLNYLEYKELQQSRKFAKQASDQANKAKYIAIFAIGFSAIFAIVSILLTMYRPVTIDQAQIDQVTKTATTIQSQIDQIINVEKTNEMQLDQLNNQIRLLTLNMQMGRMRRNYSTSSVYIKTLTPNDSVWSRYKFLGEDIILFYDHFGD